MSEFDERRNENDDEEKRREESEVRSEKMGKGEGLYCIVFYLLHWLVASCHRIGYIFVPPFD